MNILITGANGYIGSRLVKLLNSLDNISVYPLYRDLNFESIPNVKPIIANLSDSQFISSLPNNIDMVVHLAQSREYRNFPDSVDNIFSINVHSTNMLLEWCRQSGVSQFLFASSGNVYKLQNKLLTEDDLCIPTGYYGATKYAAEQLIMSYSRFFQVCILRIFGVYGPGQKNMILPNIYEMLKRGDEITLAKKSGLYFTPLYIDDCLEMLLKIFESDFKENHCIYNLAGKETINLGELIDFICSSTIIKAKIKVTDDEPTYLMGDISKFIRDFDYIPNGLIKELILKII